MNVTSRKRKRKRNETREQGKTKTKKKRSEYSLKSEQKERKRKTTNRSLFFVHGHLIDRRRRTSGWRNHRLWTTLFAGDCSDGFCLASLSAVYITIQWPSSEGRVNAILFDCLHCSSADRRCENVALNELMADYLETNRRYDYRSSHLSSLSHAAATVLEGSVVEVVSAGEEAPVSTVKVCVQLGYIDE